MYRREKTQERSYKYEKKNPSFSSIILEQIERSLDEADKHSDTSMKLKNQTTRAMEIEEEGIVMTNTLGLACLMDNKKLGDNVVGAQRRIQYYDGNKLVHVHNYINDDHDIVPSKSAHCYPSCFSSWMSKKPKPIRSTKETEKNSTQTSKKLDEILKSGTSKVYSKVKQPIHFLNSLFTVKKSKSSPSIDAVQSLSTSHSASLTPRSCLRKNSPPSCRSGKRGNDGVKKTVHFRKCLYEPEEKKQKEVDSCNIIQSPKRNVEEDNEFQLSEKTRRVDEAARIEFMRHYRQIQREFLSHVEQVDDHAVSCSSSDCFELENL